MAPATALRPYSAPCGPFRTSIWVTLFSSWLSAFGLVCSTPSITSAKLVSASRPVLMPRMTTCRSPASAVWTCDSPGVRAMKSCGRSMPAAWISVAVKAWTVTGTSSISLRALASGDDDFLKLRLGCHGLRRGEDAPDAGGEDGQTGAAAVHESPSVEYGQILYTIPGEPIIRFQRCAVAMPRHPSAP